MMSNNKQTPLFSLKHGLKFLNPRRIWVQYDNPKSLVLMAF